MSINPLKIDKPLQIIGLMFLLSETGFGFMAKLVESDKLSNFFYIAFLVLPFFTIIGFFIILYNKSNNLYGPADFKDENNYLKLQGKVKEIENSPFIIFSKIDESARRLFLAVYRENDKNKDERIEDLKSQFSDQDINNALKILNEYNWVSTDEKPYNETQEGKDAHELLKQFVYGRLG
ncbi:MAG: hypothetical protein K9M44_00065 [Candidatus Pacebacteria bacterium]|nr:hypothetical protein [Candidatus Paceibacterota bacterium]